MKTKIFSVSLFLICAVIFGIYSFFIIWKNQTTVVTIKEIPLKKIENSPQNTSDTWPIIEQEPIVLKKNTDTEVKKDEFSGKYKLFQSFVLHDSWQTNMVRSAFTNTWGEENITILKSGETKVTYPKGSYKPSSSPRWWAGFIYHTGVKRSEATLSYDITLKENFDFVKGGKLPGLCSGNCFRSDATSEEWFSLNFIWKQGGELYTVSKWPNGTTTYGNEAEKIFTLEAGKKYNIRFSIELNTPWKSDGVLKVYVNNTEIYSHNTMLLRNSENITIDALLFSTFFGGSDKSWATPVDTAITFNNFQIDGK